MLKFLTKKVVYKVLFLKSINNQTNDISEWFDGYFIFSKINYIKRNKINSINKPDSAWILFSNNFLLIKFISKISTKVVLVNKNKNLKKFKKISNIIFISSITELEKELKSLKSFKLIFFLFIENMNNFKSFFKNEKKFVNKDSFLKFLSENIDSNLVIVLNKKNKKFYGKISKEEKLNVVLV